MKTIVKFGLAALVMGAFIGVGLPVKADQLVWVASSPPMWASETNMASYWLGAM